LEVVFGGFKPIVSKPAPMKRFRHLLLAALTVVSLPRPVPAQPRPVEVPELNTQLTSSGVRNLRVGTESADGTEVLLVMEYTYNGNSGPNAQIVPVIESRKQPGVSKWFGSDRVIVPRGKGPISFKVRFFNDEPDVPATLTTDSIRILILNSTGTAIVGGSTELKTIKWGKEGRQPTRMSASPKGEKKLAQLAGEAEERAKEKARRAAEAEEKARREAADREAARAKAEAEARAAAEARARADQEARLRAEERKQAEAKAAAEAKAREAAQRKAEAEARRLEEARKQAEARARAEAEEKEKARLQAEARQREEERKKAEAEATRLAGEKRLADEQAAAEARAREETRVKAEAEASRLDEQRKAAEERARTEEEAKRAAAERAAVEAKTREQAEAQAAEAARIKAEQEARDAAQVKTDQETKTATDATAGGEGGSRTHITNIDVVNRSLDRSQMTFGIEFDRRDKFKYLGVNVEHSANPEIRKYFTCEPKEVGRQKYALVQVAYARPVAAATSVVTDRLEIYGCDSPDAAQTVPLHSATMLLVWRAPGSSGSATVAPTEADATNLVEITEFRQRTASSGYASVTYRLPEGTGQLRVRLKNASRPESTNWFVTDPVSVKTGQGLELIPVTVSADASVPAGALTVDTIEAELLDANGKTIGQSTKTTSITWARGQ
jgi:hypothetical protein